MTRMLRCFVVTVMFLAAVGCSTAPTAEETDSKPSNGAPHPTGTAPSATDPVGVASRWVDDLPGSLPTQQRPAFVDVLQPMSEARVVRVVRLEPERYDAIVATVVESGRKAVTLTIRPDGEDGWQVDRADIGSSSAFWPSL